jgi:hypothetical protein
VRGAGERAGQCRQWWLRRTEPDIRLDSLLNIYSYPGRPLIIIVYAATAIGGTLCPDDECLEACLFAPHEIPWDRLAFPSTREALRAYLDRR